MTDLELINLIAPNHDRSSCSIVYDAGNGLIVNDDKSINKAYNVACTRCALLDIAKGKAIPKAGELYLSISI